MIDLSELGDVELQEDKISDAKWLKKSGVYTAEINIAYMMESSGGAKGIAFRFFTEAGEKYTKDIYMTNKNGEPFYIDKKTKNKMPLPGLTETMKYCELILGNKNAFNDTEEVKYMVYDKDKKTEVEKTVNAVKGMTGKIVQLVLQETVEDKTVLNSGNGRYEPNGETKIVLDLKTILDGATGKTLAEKNSGSEAKYRATFLKKIAEEPVYVPKKVVGTLPPGLNQKDSGEHKPKVNADYPEDAPFG